jgi:signal transduction histidine kinase
MKISQYIFFSFLFILLLFSLTTYINFQLSNDVKDNADYLLRSSTIVRNSSRFQRNILNMQGSLRGYLLTADPDFFQAFDSAASENAAILKELGTLIPEEDIQKRRLEKIVALNNLWVNNYAYPLKRAKLQSVQSNSSLAAYNKLYREKVANGEEKEINASLQDRFKEFSNYEYNGREVRIAELAEDLRRTRILSFTFTSLSVIVGFLISWLLAYSISRRIMKMVRMADNIALGNYKVQTHDTGSDELSRLARALNHMAQVLSDSINLLKRKNEELDQFAHVVSHDLKGPLRGIDNVITWIEEDHSAEISPKVTEYLQTIKGRVRRGEALIQGILTYARTGREVGQKEQVDVGMLVQEVYDTHAPKPGISLQLSPGLPVIFTDKYPLFQVFSNLLGNALKYHNKPEGYIKVYHREFSGYYQFFVEDNGPGIAQHYHQKIFVIFQTLQDRDSLESTGVGLAIVKKILDAKKEEINVSSEPGKGSIFSFTWSK